MSRNLKQKYAWIDEKTIALKGAECTYKEEWECYRLLVGGKMFGMLGHDATGNEILTVKGEPHENAQYRDFYDFVEAGYYMNKDHWISLQLENPVFEQDFAKELIVKSYKLIYSKLPKKEKERIQSE